jgi:hypothetical protein
VAARAAELAQKKQARRAARLQRERERRERGRPGCPRHAALLFYKDVRPRVTAEHPEFVLAGRPKAEIDTARAEESRFIYGMWAALPAEEKAPYERFARYEALRYEAAMALWEMEAPLRAWEDARPPGAAQYLLSSTYSLMNKQTKQKRAAAAAAAEEVVAAEEGVQAGRKEDAGTATQARHCRSTPKTAGKLPAGDAAAAATAPAAPKRPDGTNVYYAQGPRRGAGHALRIYQTEPLCTRNPPQAACTMYVEHRRSSALAAVGLVSAADYKALEAVAAVEGVPVSDKLGGKRKATHAEEAQRIGYRALAHDWKELSGAEQASWLGKVREAEAAYLQAVADYVEEAPPRVFGCRELSREHRISLLPGGTWVRVERARAHAEREAREAGKRRSVRVRAVTQQEEAAAAAAEAAAEEAQEAQLQKEKREAAAAAEKARAERKAKREQREQEARYKVPAAKSAYRLYKQSCFAAFVAEHEGSGGGTERAQLTPMFKARWEQLSALERSKYERAARAE